MCGIAGVIGLSNGSIPEGYCNPDIMLDAIQSRGPDGVGRFDNDLVTFLHARLSIIDLDDRAAQPFHTARHVLCFNGEIFNYRDIRNELKDLGVPFRTTSDTEVLAQAIETWGLDQAVTRLSGMFAFALYDTVSRDVFLVRDRLGIKPLYYCQDAAGLAFASWPSALLKGVKRNWRLDREALQDFFVLGAAWRDRHFVAGIRDVPAGSILRVSGGQVQISSYWTPPTERRSFDTEEFSDLLQTITQAHTVSDVPVSLLLSGGIDSSALAMGLQDSDTQYFHLRSNEEYYAQSVADLTHKPLHKFDVAGDEDTERYLALMAATTGNAFAACMQPMAGSKAISDTDCKVLISANGADELFYGYPRTPTTLADIDNRLPSYEAAGSSGFSQQIHHIFRSAQSVRVPGTSDMSARQRQIEFIDQLETTVLRRDLPAAQSYRVFELETYVQAEMNMTLDHATMCYGLEARVPFLDHRMVEYALALDPADIVQHGLGRKAPLKQYLRQKGVFEELWNRPKQGFSLPRDSIVRNRRRQIDAMRSLMDDGYIEYYPKGGNVVRDYQYLLNSCHAFHIWKTHWIDGGYVSA